MTVRWHNGGAGVDDASIAYTIEHRLEVTKLTWHHKGNYLASVMPEGEHDAVAIHSIGKQATQVRHKQGGIACECVCVCVCVWCVWCVWCVLLSLQAADISTWRRRFDSIPSRRRTTTSRT